MRTYPGKTHACIIDHVGGVFRHDMPDADRQWTLDATKKKKAAADEERVQRMRCCMKCFAMNPVYRPTCEQCGVAFEPQRELPQQVAGELVEITEAQKEQMRVLARREVAKARTRSELETIAKERGYSPGWVWNMMRARGVREHA